MKNKGILKKLNFFFVLCLAVLLVLPGMSVKATETETAEYELSFTPGTGLPEKLDKGNTDYAYLDMESHANGEAKQAVYQALEEVADSFWGCTEKLDVMDGEQYALLAVIQTADLDLTAEELVEVYLMFKNDHPVYYFLSNTVYAYETHLLVLTDNINEGERFVMESAIQEYIDEHAALVDNTSDYATAKALHDALIDRMEYSYEADGITPEDAYWAHSVEGAVYRAQGVCEAYAKTYQMLLNYYGIENIYVSGVAGGDNHVWNMVKLDNDLWYYVDATWNDTGFTEQYFACGEDFTLDHTCNTPEGTAGTYLYALPEVPTENYMAKENVAIYLNGELIGKSSSFEKAFKYITDEDGEYKLELIGSTGDNYLLPEGEWPKAKLIEIGYEGNAPDAMFFERLYLFLSGDVYLNSNVKFKDTAISCTMETYFGEGRPTIYARAYTIYFSGIGSEFGTLTKWVSESEYYNMGIRIEGPEATLISDATGHFKLFETDIVVDKAYLNCILIHQGGKFVCNTLEFPERVTSFNLAPYSDRELVLDVGKLVVEYETFNVHITDSFDDNISCRIGGIYKKDGQPAPVYVGVSSGTGMKIPTQIAIEEFASLNYVMNYSDTSGYTKEELEALYQEAEAEGDTQKTNFYKVLMNYLRITELFPSEAPDDLLTYQGTLLNIGSSNLENVSISYYVNHEYENPDWYYIDEFLEVDSEGKVSRAKDEVIVVEDGVLLKAKAFPGNKDTLTIPEEVTSIAEWAVLGPGYNSITFGVNVNHIGGFVLGYVGNMESIYVLNPTVELNKYAFSNKGAGSVTVYGYAGSTAEEYVATYGEEYGLVFSALPTPGTINGVALGSDGLWAYYVDGVVDTTFTGLAANESGTWYIENGYLNWDFTDLFSWTDGWYYVMDGRVPTEYTGLVRNDAGLWYVEGGKINQEYTNLVSSAEGWFYVMDGRVTEEYTGLVRNEAGLWYVAGGKLDESHTDLVSSMDGWFYVMNGRVTEEYTGLVRNEAGLWYIANGKLDDTYTNLVSSVEGWFYAMNGRVTEEYTGLVANENGNWYVDKGAVSLTHEGLICDATGWWYVIESHVAEDYTGLATNEAGTWYVQNGYLDFGFSGEVTVGEESYTVVGGMVQ